jgi:hypothetical protein
MRQKNVLTLLLRKTYRNDEQKKEAQVKTGATGPFELKKFMDYVVLTQLTPS